MTTLEIIELIVLGAVVMTLIVFYLIKALKNDWIGKILKTINAAIKKAEATGKTGTEKKAFVMEQVEKVCDELNIPYKLIEKMVSKLIDTIVSHYNVIVK